MTIATLAPAQSAPGATSRPPGELALLLQEAFTTAVRLRSSRQRVTDADRFRAQIKQLLSVADQDARRVGYDGEHVRLAVYAFIALLDESVLTSGQPVFAAWPRQSLQEEVFGDHLAGETFFNHVEELLARPDSDPVADVLEVYQLCLLLGFRGRYAADEHDGPQRVAATIDAKIRRIRGGGPEPLSPQWSLPVDDVVPAHRDPWLPRLLWTFVASAVIAATLLLLFRYRLDTELGAFEALVSHLVR
jgi:type VI secretion system protein ImpK